MHQSYPCQHCNMDEGSPVCLQDNRCPRVGVEAAAAPVRPRPGSRTWDDGKRCSECCNGDRCDDPTHYDRTSKPGCPHCWNTGWALWTEAGQQDYAKYRRWDAYRADQVADERGNA